jgi:uncharacterized protein (TIGR02246 family)
MNNDMKAICAQRSAWIEAINARNVERYLSLVADDAVWHPRGEEPLVGKRSIKNWLENVFAQGEYRFSVANIRLRLMDDSWAMDRASFRVELVFKDGDEALIQTGRCTFVWHKSSGEWLISRSVVLPV